MMQSVHNWFWIKISPCIRIIVKSDGILFYEVTLTLYICPHFLESKGCNFSSPKNVTLYSFLYTIGQNSLDWISAIFRFVNLNAHVGTYTSEQYFKDAIKKLDVWIQ